VIFDGKEQNQHAASPTASVMQAGSPSRGIRATHNLMLSVNRQRDALSPSMMQSH